MSKVRIEIEPLKLGRLVMEKEIEEGATLRDLFMEMSKTHRDVVEIVFDHQSRKMTGAAAIVLNGRLIQALEGLETIIKDGDVIALVPVFADG